MIRIVLDTNVLLSGLIRGSGPPGRVVDALRAGTVGLVVDDRILDEYEQVLRRPLFSRYFGHAERESILSFIACNGEQTVATCRLGDLPDPSDEAFAEVALTSGVPLVTGNVRHFPSKKLVGLKVVTPAEFIREL